MNRQEVSNNNNKNKCQRTERKKRSCRDTTELNFCFQLLKNAKLCKVHAKVDWELCQKKFANIFFVIDLFSSVSSFTN